MIRLIATDLDGTLLAPDGQLAARTLEAIAAAAAAGIGVIAATGRSFRTADHRLRPAADLKTIVCSNGALVYDLHEEQIVETRPIGGDTLRALLAGMRASVPELRFGWETVHGFGLEPDFGRKPGDSEHDPTLIAGPQRAEDVTEAIKVFIAHPEVEQVELQRMLASRLPPELNGATSGARFIEVTAAGVDKGSTAAAVAASMGIDPSDVLAMGDQMNDESLLRWAGTAVAMGNARPEIKEVADVIAPPCSEDGAAQVIEQVVAGELPF